jgi:hypothetical protein
MLINQVLVDSVLRTNYLTLTEIVSYLVLNTSVRLHPIHRNLRRLPDARRRLLQGQNPLLRLVVRINASPLPIRSNNTAIHLEPIFLVRFTAPDLACSTGIADVFDKAVLIGGLLAVGVVPVAEGRALEDGAEKGAQSGQGGGEEPNVEFAGGPDGDVDTVPEEIVVMTVGGEVVDFDDACCYSTNQIGMLVSVFTLIMGGREF